MRRLRGVSKHTGSWGSRAIQPCPQGLCTAAPQGRLLDAKDLGRHESPGPAMGLSSELPSGPPGTLGPTCKPATSEVQLLDCPWKSS